MRSLIGFVVLVTVLVGLLVFVVAPVVAGPLITWLVRGALPFDDGAVSVTVDVGSSPLSGEVEGVTIGGRDLQSGDASIGTLELTVHGFRVFDRTFRTSEGRLADVTVRLEDGTAVSISLIELSGPSDAVRATATLDAAATVALIGAKFAASGIVHDRVQITDGAVEVSAGSQTVRATIEVRDDGLFLVPEGQLPALALIERDESDGWRFTSATISSLGLVLQATVDAEAVLSR